MTERTVETSESAETGGAREFDLAYFVRLFRRQWMVFAAVWLFVMVVMVLYLHIAEYQYTVTMQVSPVSPTAMRTGNLGALGSLVGINLNGGDSSSFRMYLESVSSRTAAANLLKDQHLVQTLFPQDWSPQEHRWREPPHGLLSPVTHGIKSVLGFPSVPWGPPSTERVFDYLDKNIKVVEELKSPVVTIQMETPDPEVGVALLTRLDAIADQIVRQQALTRANGYIANITDKLKSVSVTEYRQALLDNLADQEKARMMASTNVRFAADVFSAPSVSTAPTSPRAGLLLFFAFIVGLVLGSAAAIGVDVMGLRLGGMRKLPFSWRAAESGNPAE